MGASSSFNLPYRTLIKELVCTWCNNRKLMRKLRGIPLCPSGCPNPSAQPCALDLGRTAPPARRRAGARWPAAQPAAGVERRAGLVLIAARACWISARGIFDAYAMMQSSRHLGAHHLGKKVRNKVGEKLGRWIIKIIKNKYLCMR